MPQCHIYLSMSFTPKLKFISMEVLLIFCNAHKKKEFTQWKPIVGKNSHCKSCCFLMLTEEKHHHNKHHVKGDSMQG